MLCSKIKPNAGSVPQGFNPITLEAEIFVVGRQPSLTHRQFQKGQGHTENQSQNLTKSTVMLGQPSYRNTYMRISLELASFG